jgi:hypothetical protein
LSVVEKEQYWESVRREVLKDGNTKADFIGNMVAEALTLKLIDKGILKVKGKVIEYVGNERGSIEWTDNGVGKSKPYSNSKNRPKYGNGNGQVEQVYENAKQTDGKVYDPYSGEEIPWDKTKPRNGQWDMGHKPGKEYNKLWKDYMDGKITKEKFLKEYRDPDNYLPQTLNSNRSRRNELR